MKQKKEENKMEIKKTSKKKQNKNELTPEEKMEIKEEKMRQKKSVKIINRQVTILGCIFIAAFVAMMIRFGYYIQVESKTAINNNYNKRSDILEQDIHRGDILSAGGDVLAHTVDNSDGSFTREYPYNNLFCHVVGSYDMGKTGLELSENYTMLGYNENLAKVFKSDISGDKIQGNSIVTTLDKNLQQVCYDSLGDYTGAVIVSEPSTGKILAMVSKPDYNPNDIKQQWDSINAESSGDSKLLNRATQGLYAPGSTFKIVTALEYLKENGTDYSDYEYTCSGKDNFDGAAINCYHNHKHGKVNMEDSLAHSCNCSFANIGVGLNSEKFDKTINGLLFNQTLDLKDIVSSKSSFSLSESSSMDDKVQAAIGQGTTLLTPLENLMIVSSIANKGKVMKPYILDKVVSEDDAIVSQTDSSEFATFMTEDEAVTLTKLMTGVCEYGTADELSALSYKCAGKTGSAEFSSSDKSHAWFVGFAPADNPKIAVSIIVEGAGTGSQYAVPIAHKIFKSYIGK